MRPTRLSMLIASTLLAALLLVPTALAGTAIAAQVSFGPAANVATADGPASVEVHTQGPSLSPHSGAPAHNLHGAIHQQQFPVGIRWRQYPRT